MGLSAVVDNFRALKKTVKKPIVAFRETVHNAYTKAYVGSPERVDEFYTYIKVYQPSKHNDLCMMSITADINRFSMLPDKHTFFHVLKLERHFDRMIVSRKEPNVTGDMAIQILSGHNMTFMAKYRRYKARAAAKETKRNEKRHKALNVKRHTQLPHQGSSSSDSDVFTNARPATDPFAPIEKMAIPPSILPIATSVTAKTVDVAMTAEDQELAEISKAISEVVIPQKEVTVRIEFTKPENLLVAPVDVSVTSTVPEVKEDEAVANLARTKMIQKKLLKNSADKSKIPVTKKHDGAVNKFKVAKPAGVKKVEKTASTSENVQELESLDLTSAASLLKDVMEKLQLEEHKKEGRQPKIVVVSSDSDDSQDEFDNCDDDDSDDSDDGSDIEELEKIEDKDVDALEYEMI
ncbi:unnamed protein product [Caenorhabditis sp. 36 PRJEB53466]|nr:unnamed protein product [Caenorhabditis sp. 36 PRJEB53466]